jgi:hypothetical protein
MHQTEGGELVCYPQPATSFIQVQGVYSFGITLAWHSLTEPLYEPPSDEHGLSSRGNGEVKEARARELFDGASTDT